MLSYDPSETDSMLYVFDEAGRAQARKQLHDDIPRLITSYGDAIPVGDFYAGIYNATPAHMLDINSAIIENPDLEVITEWRTAQGQHHQDQRYPTYEAAAQLLSDLLQRSKQER